VSETPVKPCWVHHVLPCVNGVRTAVGRAYSVLGQKGGTAPATPATSAASVSSPATRTCRRSGRPDRGVLGLSHLTLTDRARFLGFGLSQSATCGTKQLSTPHFCGFAEWSSAYPEI
jgi:hypothetical protein